jgi:23S rRNA (uracil1939-C5)-methyltransferase
MLRRRRPRDQRSSVLRDGRSIDSFWTALYSGDIVGKPRRGDRITIAIDDLAFGGEGVGRAGGYVVFVRGGLPGDRLTVRIVEPRARFGRAEIEAVEEASPHRVATPCPYVGRCGGCRLQHMAYPAQLAFKEKQVRDCLQRLGGLGECAVRPIVSAPETFGYRNKMEFTVAGPAGAPHIGLHEAERYDVVLDIERCLLQSDTMNALLDEMREQVRARHLSVYDQQSGEGLLRFVTVREGRHTGEVMANIVAAAPAVEALAPVAEALRGRVPATTSVVLNVNGKKASVAVGTEEHLLYGRDHIAERLDGVTFQVSANSFFQTNTRQAERLFGIVAEAAALTGGETLMDLYSGTGAISLLLARRCRRVYGIEVSEAAVADAVRNAAANGIENCTFLAGEVRHVLPSLLAEGIRADVVVADPPRAGFHPKALRSLGALAPARIVYVSCNPATLARDVGDLARHGYRVEWVQPVDMFPHTPHIEAVAHLSKIP